MAIAEAPIAVTALSVPEKRKLTSLEKRIDAGLQTFREVGSALLEIRDSRLYRETHPSFEAYCAERWAMNRVRAYQLIDSAKVVQVLGDPEDLKNESQARELAPLAAEDPDMARAVWAKVEEAADATGRPVTAGLIRQMKREFTEPAATSEPSVADRLISEMSRVGSLYGRWQNEEHDRAEVRRVNAAKRTLIASLH